MDILELSETTDLDVDMNAIYKSETCNNANFNMTWMLHKKRLWTRVEPFLS